MGHPDSLLLLTRPEAQSRSFLADLEERLGYTPPVIISPVLRISPVGDPVNFDPYRTLIVTSGNAVSVLETALEGRKVVTVGERTANIARSVGADAQCLGDRVDALVERLSEVAAPALHLRGRHSRGDLVGAGRAIGIRIDECVVYDQIEEPLTAEAQAALKGGHAILPLFSPRSAALLAAYECHKSTTVLAMSPAVADAWNAASRVQVAARPDRAAMLDLVVAAF